MINIGRVNKLIVNRETTSGYYLTDKQSTDEVFMPPSLGPLRVKLTQELAVFVYLDSKGERVASTEIPFAVVGEYAMLKVGDTQDFGAFMDWGIDKDLLVPGNEQKVKMRQYEHYLVRVCLEEGTNRIYGTSKIGKYVESADFDIMDGDKVKIEPVDKTPLGYKIIINRKYVGLIYQNEIFTGIKLGEIYDGVVKKIRNDGFVDCALQTQGIDNLVESKDKVIKLLEESNGKTFLHDKSTPSEIKNMLGMSKKTFKSVIGMLYKEKKILIKKGEGLELI